LLSARGDSEIDTRIIEHPFLGNEMALRFGRHATLTALMIGSAAAISATFTGWIPSAV
jgi:hypothetical protein